MKRLMKLARESKTFEAFTAEALRWPRWFGFPGTGTKDDYQTFYNMAKREEK